MTSGLEVTLVLLTSVVLGVVVFRLLSLPPLLGYLAVGILIGPHAFRLVPDTAQTRYLAEFGVVFLMFSIGLEFSLPRLRSMRRIVFGLGGAQVGLTVLLTLAAGWLIRGYTGIGLAGTFALGSALAMSSTAIIMKMLSERMQLDTEHGKRIVGVLLFQDLAVVPLLVIIPALSADPAELGWRLGLAMVKAAALLAVLLVGGQRVLRGWLHLVAKRKSHELFTLNVLLVTLGLAWMTEIAGLSLALGAFVAGMLISETEFRVQVEEDIKPFRDVLLGLFFVTIGMLLNPRIVLEHLGWVMLALIVPVAFKAGLIYALARVFRASAGTAIRTALALCTAGEFGFVLLGQAGRFDLLESDVLQVVLAAMLLSMLAAPLLVQHADRIVMRLASSEWMLKSLELAKVAQRAMATDRHVVICGFGRSGQHLAKMLEQEGIGYVALDVDPDLVREAAAAGESVVYGDAARRETLVAAGIGRAAALVITYADSVSALKVLHHAHELRPNLNVIIRTQDDHELDRLMKAGATEVVPEVFEGSLMLGSHALVLLGVPMARVLRRVREARDQRYRLLRGYFHGAGDEDASIEEEAAERLHSVMVETGAVAVGRRIVELALAELGVEVTAVRRRGIRGAEPSPDMVLHAGDVLVLRGLPDALESAEERVLLR
ncbi:MAG TPA: cation:proton antiporter [Burkholderiaceae bacterium]|nr:cation:proton antiporter [Burkholderiaceae bacterium]HQR71172.1 cation:proton antiporter [Burkholderiaceae bacterium]